jgi:hypothetical protein
MWFSKTLFKNLKTMTTTHLCCFLRRQADARDQIKIISRPVTENALNSIHRLNEIRFLIVEYIDYSYRVLKNKIKIL